MTIWEDDHVQRNGRRRWRGSRGRRGILSRKDTRRREGRVEWDKNKYVTIINRA